MPAREITEPADLAVTAIARSLRSITESEASARELRGETGGPSSPSRGASPSAWLLLFLDLLDKAAQAAPHEHLLATVQGALASAPKDDREAAREAARQFEQLYRRGLKEGAPFARGDRAEREVLLIVPKPLERKACAAVFDAEGVEAKPFDSHVRYRRFELHESTPSTTITMVCIQEAGNLRAARVVRDYIMAFGRPDVAVLCGMAMGITDKVALGDVVVPRQVIDYQPRRVTPAGDQLRFETYRLRDTVANDVAETADTNAADVEALFRETVARMAVHMPFPADVLPPADDQRKPFVPRIRAGALLAGEELVEDGSGPERAQMHDRIYALDMEGAGFASECEAIRLDWLIVRGIADTGEPGREKTWQAAATVAAAAFVKTFLHSGWRPDIG